MIEIEDCVRIEIERLEKNLRTSREELLKVVDRTDVFGTNSFDKSREDIQQENETIYMEIKITRRAVRNIKR